MKMSEIHLIHKRCPICHATFVNNRCPTHGSEEEVRQTDELVNCAYHKTHIHDKEPILKKLSIFKTGSKK
jgi:hypothetical protein